MAHSGQVRFGSDSEDRSMSAAGPLHPLTRTIQRAGRDVGEGPQADIVAPLGADGSDLEAFGIPGPAPLDAFRPPQAFPGASRRQKRCTEGRGRVGYNIARNSSDRSYASLSCLDDVSL
jgi:hypothetical protein